MVVTQPISLPKTKKQGLMQRCSLGWNPENRSGEPRQDPVVLLGEAQVIQVETQNAMEDWEEEENDQDLAAAADEVERSMTEEDGSWEAMDLSGEHGPTS